MSVIDNTPTDRNFLSDVKFKFMVKKCPNVNFWVQKVNIPSLMLPEVNTSNPFVTTPYPGEHVKFGELSITFRIDENLQNYLEIHNWLKALGKPENFEQYAAIQDIKSWTGEGIYSDISLIILTSAHNANYEVVYTDGFPTSLSEVVFDSTTRDVNFLEATAKFRYTVYDINKVN